MYVSSASGRFEKDGREWNKLRDLKVCQTRTRELSAEETSLVPVSLDNSPCVGSFSHFYASCNLLSNIINMFDVHNFTEPITFVCGSLYTYQWYINGVY